MWGAIGTLIAAPARGNESCYGVLRLLDSTPVACGTSRETVKRCDLTGYAGYGYCASRSRYFWDFRLQLISTSEGKPVILGSGPPETRGTRSRRGVAAPRPSSGPRWTGHQFRQGFRREGLRALRHRGTRSQPGAAGPQKREDPVREIWGHATVDRVRL